jgi:hypothetical protein
MRSVSSSDVFDIGITGQTGPRAVFLATSPQFFKFFKKVTFFWRYIATDRTRSRNRFQAVNAIGGFDPIPNAILPTCNVCRTAVGKFSPAFYLPKIFRKITIPL